MREKREMQAIYFDNIEERNALLNYFEENNYRWWVNNKRPLQVVGVLPGRGYFITDCKTLIYGLCDSNDELHDVIKLLSSPCEILGACSLIGDFKLPKEADLIDFLEV